MSRNLLHKSKLEAFKAWLVEQDIPFRPGKGEWQELQVRLPSSTVYAAVYSRADMPEHLSVDRRLDSLVNRFCQHKPQSSAPIQQCQHADKKPAPAEQLAAAPAVQGEPVAWQLRTPEGRVILNKEFPAWADGGDGYKITPLYTAPQPGIAKPPVGGHKS